MRGQHGEMFYGMSSVKEYWKRTRATASSDFEITSSDYSSDDSNSSSSKEYRDASCNVDFDDETPDELIDKNLPNVKNKLTKNFYELSTKSTGVKNLNIKTSRYIRWNVLMSLGIGLWAVLCIVDLLHSEESVTRDWLYQGIWGKKISPKVELPKKLDPPILWYSNLWPYLWKIVTITTSGGAYILLFLLMIVFCVDPRLRNTGPRSSVKNKVSTRTSPPNETTTNNFAIVERKSHVVEKKLTIAPRFEELRIPKIVSIRLELLPSVHPQNDILSSIEKCVQADFKKLKNLPPSNSLYPRETRVVRIFGEIDDDRGNKSSACFSINGQLVELLDAKEPGTVQFSRYSKIDWSSFKKINSFVKDSTSLCLVNARSRRDLNLNASTYDLEIGDYLGRTRQLSRSVFREDSFGQRRQNFVNIRPDVTNYEIIMKNCIITSSPAFKKFLSNFPHNNGVS